MLYKPSLESQKIKHEKTDFTQLDLFSVATSLLSFTPININHKKARLITPMLFLAAFMLMALFNLRVGEAEVMAELTAESSNNIVIDSEFNVEDFALPVMVQVNDARLEFLDALENGDKAAADEAFAELVERQQLLAGVCYSQPEKTDLLAQVCQANEEAIPSALALTVDERAEMFASAQEN